MLTEDGLILLLTRLESAASRRDKACAKAQSLAIQVRDLHQTLVTAQSANRRHERDMLAYEKKMEEWIDYAATLTTLIGPRRRNDIPKKPGRLEIEIPF